MGGKEMMLAEDHGRMQKAAPAVGQRHQAAVARQDAHAPGRRQTRWWHVPHLEVLRPSELP